MSGSLGKLGFGKETTYGTGVAVTKRLEFISEDFRGSYPRLQGENLSSSLVDRADRYAINAKGASGSVTFEPLTKGFGDLLAFMQGAVATTGAGPSYTHTATVDSLSGKMLTVQVARPDEGGVLRPWTYEGGKVTSWELSNSVDQTLRASLSFDFSKESNPDSPSGIYTVTALDALTIPTGAEVFNWQGGTVTLAGSTIKVSEFSVSVNNALNTDRWFIGQTGKAQPHQDGKRTIEWSMTVAYENNDMWQKVSSATTAGAAGEIKAKWEGLTLITGVIYPTIEVTIPYARFDEGGPVIDGPNMLTQTFSGVGLYDGTNSPITVKYISTDATVLS